MDFQFLAAWYDDQPYTNLGGVYTLIMTTHFFLGFCLVPILGAVAFFMGALVILLCLVIIVLLLRAVFLVVLSIAKCLVGAGVYGFTGSNEMLNEGLLTGGDVFRPTFFDREGDCMEKIGQAYSGCALCFAGFSILCLGSFALLMVVSIMTMLATGGAAYIGTQARGNLHALAFAYRYIHLLSVVLNYVCGVFC
jgi:hypothetical protein